jgi:hypothetical protein
MRRARNVTVIPGRTGQYCRHFKRPSALIFR